MRHALALASRGLGRTAPNPAVGCVVVKAGRVIGRGRTGDGGRPHAEISALAQAGGDAQGATAYVTLEPCAHEGETPSCAKTLIEAGIARVAIACTDPDPRTAGRGAALLREAGMEVMHGLLEAEAQALNRGFLLRLSENRPFATLKTASTLDGKIALPGGESQWITGPEARAHVHHERARHDTIITGIGTVLADDPLLTTRIPGFSHEAVRVILDTHLRVDLASKLVQTAKISPLWIVHRDGAADRIQALESKNVRVLNLPEMSIPAVLQRLAQEGHTRILVEGGPRLLTSFLRAGLWDRLLWYRAPAVMGEGMDAFGPFLREGGGLAEMPRGIPSETRLLGQDRLEIYEREA
ncbi:MAG: bifunctional diaminohydroxyphosphoribosylaminopyrimidine deaminase/5-amino-6-(5-phosphoribosylamino)uracil reductase RibD [Alphaproteobacteria bacterium]|nr:bifunctional diaminohydroxyphosphoribosylaminopyrimidine deaminase/5-amino-6-(5-phosphoribosylamino)uracil reductase RibD [Alphaproteobacteria bacterium]